jgi:hypothetical protein
MRIRIIIGLVAVCLPAAVSAEASPRFELGLECAAAATVSNLLLKQTNAPAELQESYTSILASAGGMLHDLAPAAGMTDEQVDLEIVNRSNVLVDRINAVPDDGYQAAVFQQISLKPDGGMAACSQLLNEVTIVKKAE